MQQWVGSGGAQVFFIESPWVPILDVQIDFDAGARRDPRDKAGLAAATAELLLRGVRAGVDHPALDENALGEQWADLGAQFDGQASADRLSFTLRTLTEPEVFDKAVALMALQLGEPAFAPDIWRRERDRIDAALAEADTRPATLALRAFNARVYGGHPYGFEMTRQTLARIGVADMAALHQRWLRQCGARVSLVGAIGRAQAERVAAQLLARLPKGACAPAPALPQVQALHVAHEERIDFDAVQAHVLLGQPGIRRDDPDFMALTLGNFILGAGGFGSRLTQELREQRGLTYAVESVFEPGLHAGAFSIGMQTRPDQAEQALAVVRAVLNDLVRQGPTEAEVAAAKANLIGGHALRFDSNQKLLGNLSYLAWYQLPLSHFETWPARMAAVSVHDVRRALANTLKPEKMITILLGAKP